MVPPLEEAGVQVAVAGSRGGRGGRHIFAGSVRLCALFEIGVSRVLPREETGLGTPRS